MNSEDKDLYKNFSEGVDSNQILLNQITHSKPKLYNSLGGAHCLREVVLEYCFDEFTTWDEVICTFSNIIGEEYITSSFINRRFVPSTSMFANIKLGKQLCAFSTVETGNSVLNLLEVGKSLQNFSGATFNMQEDFIEETNNLEFPSIVSFISTLVNNTPHKKGRRGIRRGAVSVLIDINSAHASESISYLSSFKTLSGIPEILIDDAFMNKVLNNHAIQIYKKGKIPYSREASDVLYDIAESIKRHSRPGIIFNLNEYSHLAPCGEIACNANEMIPEASLNLPKFIKKTGEIDWELFKQSFIDVVKFLNKIIDTTPYLNSTYKETSKKAKNIGIGIMGFADICMIKNIKFPSIESNKLFNQILIKLKEYSELSEITNFSNQQLFAFSPTGTRSVIGKCSPSIFSYFDCYTTSCLKQSQKENAINSKLVLLDKDWELEDYTSMVKMVEEILGGRVSYNITLNAPSTDQIYELIIKSYKLGVNQVSFFSDFGNTKDVSDTLITPKEDL